VKGRSKKSVLIILAQRNN